MASSELQQRVETLNKDLPAAEIRGQTHGSSPRFELYGAGISICSQKVRTVLLEKGEAYYAHELNPVPGRIPVNYLPPYILMRLMGVKAQGLQQVSGFSGNSSVETEGVDLLAVPTLVDHEAGRVVVDSQAICNYIDDVIGGSDKLIPVDLREVVQRHIRLVDLTPHVGMLYGQHPTLDRRPAVVKSFAGPSLPEKIAMIRQIRDDYATSDELKAIYKNKIAKEEACVELNKEQHNIEGIYLQVEDILGELEKDLSESKGTWLFDDRYTMADLFWGINLFRLQNMGVKHLFGDRTMTYAGKLFQRQSLKDGVIGFPNCWFYAPEHFGMDIMSQYVGMKPAGVK